MYELNQVGEKTYYINCPAKIGIYKLNDTDVYLVDSGNDKDAGRKVHKILNENGWSLKGIINTHSNADQEGTLVRYPGNYTHFREEKRKNYRLQQKAYERQQEEIKRLEGLVERFKHKPRKAAFARAKKKTLERMERVEQPKEEVTVFAQEITPLVLGSKWVFESEHLEIGYGKPLFEITMRIKRGQKIGILGANGVGKTTLLKTVSGLCAPVKGTYTLGNQIGRAHV